MGSAGRSHQILVLYTHHLAGQHGVPVIHQRQIAPVVPPEIIEVITERLSLGEVLLEEAQAAIHRVPARVNDDGVRQNHLDQADMA